MKKELLELLAQNHLFEIVERLQNDLLFEEKEDVSLLSGRLVELKKKEANSIISEADAQLERNKIAHSLSEIIRSLPNDNKEIIKNDNQQPIITQEIIEDLCKKPPPQYQSIENILKYEDIYWQAINLKRPKKTVILTFYYSQNAARIISQNRVILSENKVEFSGYFERAVESLKILIIVISSLQKLFQELKIIEIGEKTERLNKELIQIKLNLLNIKDTKELKRFHSIEIRSLIFELIALETLLKYIYE